LCTFLNFIFLALYTWDKNLKNINNNNNNNNNDAADDDDDDGVMMTTISY